MNMTVDNVRLHLVMGGRQIVHRRVQNIAVDMLARVDMKHALPDRRRKLVMTGVFLFENLVSLIPPTLRTSRRRQAAA